MFIDMSYNIDTWKSYETIVGNGQVLPKCRE